MRRFAVAVTTVVLTMAVLVACGGSDYCDSVEKNQKTLNTFGEKRTNEAYTAYAKLFTSVGNLSPNDVKADWKKTRVSDRWRPEGSRFGRSETRRDD